MFIYACERMKARSIHVSHWRAFYFLNMTLTDFIYPLLLTCQVIVIAGESSVSLLLLQAIQLFLVASLVTRVTSTKCC